MSQLEDNTPRPVPPSDVIENLEKKIEVQYKIYPKVERTPPRPISPKAPLPPERSNSQGRLKGKEENERMKIAAEEKKKREEDDKRLQIEKEEKN